MTVVFLLILNIYPANTENKLVRYLVQIFEAYAVLFPTFYV